MNVFYNAVLDGTLYYILKILQADMLHNSSIMRKKKKRICKCSSKCDFLENYLLHISQSNVFSNCHPWQGQHSNDPDTAWSQWVIRAPLNYGDFLSALQTYFFSLQLPLVWFRYQKVFHCHITLFEDEKSLSQEVLFLIGRKHCSFISCWFSM